MRKLLIKLSVAMLVLAASLLALSAWALRENPARDAIGMALQVEHDGATIEYFKSEPDNVTTQPETVVLLASYARSVSDFNELVVQLNGAGYRTLAMQARGVGGSQPASLNLNYQDYASDALAVIDREQVGRPLAMIGHAWGNRIARTFSAYFPDRSGGLILLAAGGETPTPRHVSAAIMKAMLNVFPDSTRLEAIRLAFFATENAIPEYWLRGWYPRAGIAQARATAAAQNDGWQDGGNAPMVVVQPAADAATADGGEKLMQRLPGRVELIVIDGAGHALLPEQPGRVAGAVLAALESF